MLTLQVTRGLEVTIVGSQTVDEGRVDRERRRREDEKCRRSCNDLIHVALPLVDDITKIRDENEIGLAFKTNFLFGLDLRCFLYDLSERETKLPALSSLVRRG
jgi:hypothetical protein